jgi:hypothetical protein
MCHNEGHGRAFCDHCLRDGAGQDALAFTDSLTSWPASRSSSGSIEPGKHFKPNFGVTPDRRHPACRSVMSWLISTNLSLRSATVPRRPAARAGANAFHHAGVE